MYLFIILLTLFCLNSSEKWVTSSINEMVGARSCLHQNHLVLIDDLFIFLLNDIEERNLLESIGLEHLGRMLSSGMGYCMAFKDVIRTMHRYLKSQILSNRGNLTHTNMKKNGWLNTETHLQNTINSVTATEKCNRLNDEIPVNDPKKYNGVLSKVIECLHRHRKNTIKKYIIHQFSHDEKLTTESIRKTKSVI